MGFLLSAILLCASCAWAKPAGKKPAKAHKVTASAHSSKSKTSAKSNTKKKSKKAWQSKGQKAISSDRTREIQEALIREKYMSGEPSGNMDSATKQALIKLQQDNGWQTKVVPDSRALIRLGLGPSQTNLLNPDTAAIAGAVGTK